MNAESTAGRGLPKCADGTLYHCVDGKCSCPSPAYRDMADDVFGPGQWAGDTGTYEEQADAVFGPGQWAKPEQPRPRQPVVAQNQPPPPAPPRPSPDAKDAVRKLLQLRARQQYERAFGAPGPFGSAASLGINENDLLQRVRDARAAGTLVYAG